MRKYSAKPGDPFIVTSERPIDHATLNAALDPHCDLFKSPQFPSRTEIGKLEGPDWDPFGRLQADNKLSE